MQKSKITNMVLIVLSLIAVSVITVLATGAWFSYTKQTAGTITLKNGIAIEYTGLEGTTNKTLVLSSSSACTPGELILIDQVSVKKPPQESGKTEYSDFYFRFKVKYEYSLNNGSTWLEASASDCYLETALIVAPANSSIAGFKPYGQNWFYYFQNSSLEEISNLAVVSSTPISLFSNYTGESKPAVKLKDNIPENYKIRITVTVDAIQNTFNAASDNNWCV